MGDPITLKMTGGQGITQTIAQKLNLSAEDLKKINQNKSVWSNVLNEVKSGQIKNGNTSSNSKIDGYESDNYKSKGSWAFAEGDTVTISGSSWSNITQLLNIAKGDIKKTVADKNENDFGKLDTMDNQNSNAIVKEQLPKPNIEVSDYVTGKQITRSVNGKPQTIEIVEVDGQKVRFAVNKDGTRGEPLVTVTTAGKNKYVTQSQFNNTVKTVLKLGENDEIPKDLKPEYISIGGEPSLVFKGADGHVMTSSELQKFMADYKKTQVKEVKSNENPQVHYNAQTKQFSLGQSIQSSLDNISNNFTLSGQLKSGASGSSVKYNGAQYTIAIDTSGKKLLKDAKGNYFKYDESNDKLTPADSPQIQMYGYDWAKGTYKAFNSD